MKRRSMWGLVILAFLTAVVIILGAFVSSILFMPAGKHGASMMQGVTAMGVFAFSLLCVASLWVIFGDKDQDNPGDNAK